MIKEKKTINLSLNIVLAGVFAFSLSACLPEDSATQNEGPSTRITDETNVGLEAPVVMGEAVTEAYDINYDPALGYFILSLGLKSEPGQPNKAYTDISPAMPMVASGLAIYLHDDSYKFQLSHADGTSTETIAGNPTEWTSIRLVNLPSGSTLLVNKVVVLTGPRVKPLNKVTVGKGYRDRAWTGRILDYKVCSAPNLSESGQPANALICP